MTTPPIPFFGGHAAFGLRLGQLLSTVVEQIDASLQAAGLELPGTTTAVLQLLYHAGPHTLTDIATRLSISHQLTSQRVRRLESLGLARADVDPGDRRRRRVGLTARGRQEGERFQGYLADLEQAFTQLFDEVGLDVHRAVLDTHRALAATPLADRMGLVITTESTP